MLFNLKYKLTLIDFILHYFFFLYANLFGPFFLQKEKDIELTARIGKELLSHNAKLENTIATLETELRHCQDKITQLSHELLKKNELLQILTNDIDEPGSEAG